MRARRLMVVLVVPAVACLCCSRPDRWPWPRKASTPGCSPRLGRTPQGRYDAHVVVPEGGIGAVQIGLRGTSDGASSDVLFPLENDPFAAPARGSATNQEASSDNSLPAWPALALLAVLGAVIWRARWRTAAS
jgi:hypothetical protein